MATTGHTPPLQLVALGRGEVRKLHAQLAEIEMAAAQAASAHARNGPSVAPCRARRREVLRPELAEASGYREEVNR
jgi:hypothetical protein